MIPWSQQIGKFSPPTSSWSPSQSRLSRQVLPGVARPVTTAEHLRLVFHQPLRETAGAMRSIVDLLGVDLAIPDHTTFSRRGGTLKVLRQRVERNETLHVSVDSTGVK
jgi:hypothetical protein